MSETKQTGAAKGVRPKAVETMPQRMKIKKPGRHSLKSDLPFYLILLPAVVVVFLFKYLPMSGLLLAFKEYNPKLGIWGSPWTEMGGFSNFVEIFKTPAFAESIWNTFYFNALNLLIGFPMPIILALLIAELNKKLFKKTVQTISYLPHFLSVAAVTAIVNNLLDSYGLLNGILTSLGLDPVYLLKNESAFLPTYIITSIWQTMGWGSIIYLATIAGISRELYEAAAIDGAGRLRQILHITLPGLMPTAMIMLIIRVGSIFGSSFELVYGLQNPVAWTDEVISTAVYKYGIGQGEYSVATALGLLQGVVAFVLTFGANAISKKVSNVSMW